MFISEPLKKQFGEYAIRPVTKGTPLVQKDGFAIALIFTNTSEPEALVRNTQTGYVIVYDTIESAQQRLQSLPAPFVFDVNSRTVYIPWPETTAGNSRPFTFQLTKWRTNASSRW